MTSLFVLRFLLLFFDLCLKVELELTDVVIPPIRPYCRRQCRSLISFVYDRERRARRTDVENGSRMVGLTPDTSALSGDSRHHPHKAPFACSAQTFYSN
jgi:hypothetical protein